MKARHFLVIAFAVPLFFSSCLKNKLEIGGDQSPMGEVGAEYSISEYAVSEFGISNVLGTVISLNGGVSNMTLTATVTNAAIRNVLSNLPGTTVSGNNVNMTIKYKSTKDGLSVEAPLAEGIIVDYDAKVGDTYKMSGSNRKREVVARSTDDDHPYGFYYIKVTEILEPTESFGIRSVTYLANHKFGLVGLTIILDDGTEISFPVYSSADNF